MKAEDIRVECCALATELHPKLKSGAPEFPDLVAQLVEFVECDERKLRILEIMVKGPMHSVTMEKYIRRAKEMADIVSPPKKDPIPTAVVPQEPRTQRKSGRSKKNR